MDKLSLLYGLVASLGTLIGAIDHFIVDLRAKGTITDPAAGAIAPAVVAAKDAHAALVAALPPR